MRRMVKPLLWGIDRLRTGSALLLIVAVITHQLLILLQRCPWLKDEWIPILHSTKFPLVKKSFYGWFFSALTPSISFCLFHLFITESQQEPPASRLFCVLFPYYIMRPKKSAIPDPELNIICILMGCRFWCLINKNYKYRF